MAAATLRRVNGAENAALNLIQPAHLRLRLSQFAHHARSLSAHAGPSGGVLRPAAQRPDVGAGSLKRINGRMEQLIWRHSSCFRRCGCTFHRIHRHKILFGSPHQLLRQRRSNERRCSSSARYFFRFKVHGLCHFVPVRASASSSGALILVGGWHRLACDDGFRRGLWQTDPAGQVLDSAIDSIRGGVISAMACGSAAATVRMDAEAADDNGAGHLVIASLELTCLNSKRSRADPFPGAHREPG